MQSETNTLQKGVPKVVDIKEHEILCCKSKLFENIFRLNFTILSLVEKNSTEEKLIK